MDPKNYNFFSSSSGYPFPSNQRTASSSASHHYFTSEGTSNSHQNPVFNPYVVPNPSPIGLSSSLSRTPVPRLGRQTLYDPNYTLTTTDTTTKSHIIMCVTEGSGHSKGTVGMAAIDLYSPELELSQFTDDLNYENLRNKVINIQPSIVLLPNTFFNEENRLFKCLSTQLEGIVFETVDRRTLNDGEGLEQIRRLRCDDCFSIEIQLKSKYYCLSASAALLKYLESKENLIYCPKSLKIVVKSADNTMFIDPTTAKLLELIVNLNDPKSCETVFGTINKTKTRSGYRLLRSNLLQPTTDIKIIESRHQMIEEIVSSETLFEQLGSVLTKFTGIEVERVISCLIQSYKNTNPEPNVKSADRKIECILILKHILSLIPSLIETLSLSEENVFNQYIEVLKDQRFEMILIAINEYITEDCKYSKGGLKMKLQKCSAIKRGINSLLDIARDAYSESIDDIYHLIQRVTEQYKEVFKIKESFTPSRGYHMEIVSKDVSKKDIRLPPEFIRIVFNKRSINFSTQELINKNNRINSAIEEIYLMSDSVITVLIENIRQFIGCLYNLAEIVSKIDLIYSLSSQCAHGNYVRPKFSDYIAIKQGIHPVLEKVLNEKPVPNDIFLSEDFNFVVITGPNMSGKSILLKQVAILQVMAQIGSYIPAEFATFRIFDKLFSRIGNNDEIETNSSTFMVEMREMSYILRNISNSCLVIIDELGRGTTVEEGVGLCFAINEHLLQTNAFTLLATHFIELTKLENFYLNVSNFNFGFQHQNEGQPDETYKFTHVLESGATKELFYGLRLANSTAMDPKILAKAHHFAQMLQNTQKPTQIRDQITQTQRIYYKIASTLKTMVRDGEDLDLQTLKEMQNYFLKELEEAANQQTEEEGLHF